MTNNPTFDYQSLHMMDYMTCSSEEPENKEQGKEDADGKDSEKTTGQTGKHDGHRNRKPSMLTVTWLKLRGKLEDMYENVGKEQ